MRWAVIASELFSGANFLYTSNVIPYRISLELE